MAAASLAAFYSRVKVGHVAVGCAPMINGSTFREEINRRVAGVIADMHFAPTERASENLIRENTPDGQIIVTGNPVIDALHWVATLSPTTEVREFLKGAGIGEAMVKGHTESQQTVHPHLVLATAHRRENFGQPLENICLALREIALHYDRDVRIVYSVHMNPNVWDMVHRLLGNVPNITLAQPRTTCIWYI